MTVSLSIDSVVDFILLTITMVGLGLFFEFFVPLCVGAVLFALLHYLWGESDEAASAVPTLIVLGSGGHTCEMLKLVSALDAEIYSPRTFVVADTDTFSALKAEQEMKTSGGTARIVTIPRSREVGQSWASTVLSTLKATLACVAIYLRIRPKLVLCNGPGTCVPVCAVAWIYSRVLRLRPSCRIMFVESVCRVTTLSLTGKILSRLFADEVLVQWPEMAKKFPGTKYIARFV